ncbi:MAG: hypothetical protein R3322_03520 [Kiloniellales bacterium]|nr:hypothetical protein [Kiloniellales bacterium]
MRTLLILGSMPEPSLPPKAGFDDVACANASGHSAARYGLPDPVYTVMTSMLASGIGSGRQSLEALRGLETGTVYFLWRRTERMTPIKRALFFAKNLRGKSILRMQPAYLKAQLKALGYRFGAFVALDEKYYDGLVRTLCGDDHDVLSQMERKRPSTGVIAVALGLARHSYDRYVIAGFSFELTHAYAHNPEIEERGTRVSAHAETDITVLRYLARQRHDLYTSEEAVHRATGIPLLPEGPAG